jgi:hypothetical protein
MDSKDVKESNSFQDPPLLRKESSGFSLNYSVEEIPPMPSTVTSTVESEDVPTPIAEELSIESVAESSTPSTAKDPLTDSDDEEGLVLRPPPARKVLGHNYSFYAGTSSYI